MSSSAAGVTAERGSASRRRYASRGAQQRGEAPLPAWQSSMRKRPRRPYKGAARIRREQQDQGPQATHRGRYPRQSADSGSAFGRHPGSGGCASVLRRLFCRIDTITKVFVEGGYTGKLMDWARDMFGYAMEVVKRSAQHTFQVLPKRWIVERTFAWLHWSRRLSKDYELRHTSAETMIYIVFAHQMLRRLH